MSLIRDCIAICGFAMIVYGTWEISRSTGLIVGGSILLFAAGASVWRGTHVARDVIREQVIRESRDTADGE